MVFRFILMIVVATFMVVTISSCAKCKKGISPYNLYGGSATIFPNKDSVYIGDTIYFNVSIPAVLKWPGPVGDSSNIDMSGASGIATEIHLDLLTGLNTINNAIDSFLYISEVGNISTNPNPDHIVKNIGLITQKDSFVFSMAFVPLKRGVYCFTLIDILNASKNCITAQIATPFQNIDQHLYFLQNIYYGVNPIDPKVKTNSYCFKVQ